MGVLSSAEIEASGYIPVDQVARVFERAAVGLDIVSLASTPSKWRVALDPTTYDLGNRTALVNQDGLYAKGVRGRTVLTTTARTLLDLGNVRNCVFEDIDFVVTASFTDDDAVNAVVRVLQRVAINNVFYRCRFSMRNGNANGLKLIADAPGKYIQGFHLYECLFDGCGRIAIELSNDPLSGQGSTDAVFRIADVVAADTRIIDTGLVSTNDNGQGVSIHGLAEDCRFDVRVDNYMFAAIENVGARNSKFGGRATNARDTTGGTATAGLSLTTQSRLAAIPAADNQIIGFTTDLTPREHRIWNQKNLTSLSNRLACTGGGKGSGMVDVAGVSGSAFISDLYDCDGLFALNVSTRRFNGGGPAFGNDWQDLRIDHSRRTTAPAGLINFSGNGTDNNNINGLTYTPQSATEKLVQGRAESTLTARIDNGTAGNAGQILTVTAQSGEPLVVGQRLYGDNVGGNTVISALDGTGTGGTGTYSVTPSQTAASGSVRAGNPRRNFIRGAKMTTGMDIVVSTYQMQSDTTIDLTLLDDAPNLLATGNLTITSSIALTATRSLVFPEGGPTQRVTNNTTGGQAILVRNKTGGASVTIASGTTVNIRWTDQFGSTSPGFYVVP